MIKVQSNTATREPIPRFLRGLSRESLADLSWTDPALGVQDAAWWPVEDQSPQLGEYERYGEETLTLDMERRVVISVRDVEPMSDEEIREIRKAQVPQQVTQRQARLVLLQNGLLDAAETAINAIEDEAVRQASMIEWEYASVIKRDSPTLQQLAPALGLTEDQLDDLFIQAAQLPG